jgi:ABC-type transport system involved in Fe-S cluster assembly fused permease/ATPase subunit
MSRVSTDMQVTRSSNQTLREAARLFWAVADGFTKRRLMAALVVVASGALLAAATPVALKLAVDSLSASALATPGGDSNNYVGLISFGPVALVIAYAIGQYLTRVLGELRYCAHGQAEQRLRRHVGLRLFDHLMRLPMKFHMDRKTGAIGEIAEQGVRGYQLLLSHATFTILPVAVEFAAVAAVLVHFGHGVYLWIIAVASLAYMVAFHRGAVAIKSSSSELSKSHIDAHAVLTDSLLNYETIKYFDAEATVSRRYDAALGSMESAWRMFYIKRLENGALIGTIFALSLGASLYFAAHDVMRGTMTVGGFVLVNAYIVRLVQPLELLGFAVRDIAQGIAFLQSLLDLLQQSREPDAPIVPGERKSSQSQLAFAHVDFSYGDKPILRDVSFAVPAGATVALVGASGSGKTSIIRLLFRLYEPNAGHILLDNTPISELSLSLLRRAIAVVPQDTVLFHETIANNIGFGRHGANREEIEEAARIAHLDEFIRSLPQGFETVVGERGLKLSGGERQRVAIARAALKQPRIYVFDEATSSLDTRTEREILRNLNDVSARCTTLVIAHRLSTVVHADEILVLDHGSIIERGKHDALLSQNGAYAGLWRAQQHGSAATRAKLPEVGIAKRT